MTGWHEQTMVLIIQKNEATRGVLYRYYKHFLKKIKINKRVLRIY